MDETDWISIVVAAVAAAVAAVAFVTGEVRARAARRDSNDHNDVEWVVQRGYSDGDITLLNIGLDEARKVRIRVVHEQMPYVQTFDRVTPTEPESVSIPSLEPLWQDFRRRGSDSDQVVVASVGVRIAWESPRGKREVAAFSANVLSHG